MSISWQRVEELFHQAVDLAPDERRAFLAKACDGDDGVRREVDSLLAADDSGRDLPQPFLPRAGEMSAGQWLEHYEILAVGGRGATGTVYRARDTRTSLEVAVKVFQTFVSPEQRRRYLTEARTALTLHHPYLVAMHEIGRAQGRDYLVMEYVEGRTLGEAIPTRGLRAAGALRLARMIAEGLAAAHQAGIVHRDLKPANVMLDTSGGVRILDFGLAKLIETDGAPSMKTVTGQILGTACYLSPEQAEGKPVDARSDIFSFGVLLYEMVTGERPFDRGSLAGTLSAILRDSPVSMRKLRPGTRREVAEIVERCIEKDREKRYASAKELLQAIAACEARVNASPNRLWRLLRRKRVLIPSITALAIVAAGLAYLAVRMARIRRARETVAPRIAMLVQERLYNAADELTASIENIVPAQQQVRDFRRDYRLVTSIVTTPPGAEVAIKDYATPDALWRPLGKTPLTKITVPLGYMRWLVSAPGYRTREFAETAVLQPTIRFALYTDAGNPPEMVLVPEGYTRGSRAVKVSEFWLDQFEVTNRQYQEFVNAGGYQKPEFWQEPFDLNGAPTGRDRAVELFRDQTGRPGPAGWELGNYPEGKAAFPVTGVSWFEAAAYARFAGKRLPAYREWLRAARTEWLYADATLLSKFSQKGLAAVGSYRGLDRFGTYDLAGNCKEWIWNEWRPGQRLVLGGAWDEAYYAAGEPDAAAPMERRPNIGFRCARSANPLPADFTGPVHVQPDRDYAHEKLVSEGQFASFLKLYDYEHTPLQARVESTDDTEPHWRQQKISFETPYGGERQLAYLFLPRTAVPPYQTVVYFASGIALAEKSSSHLEMWYLEPLIRSGRAVLYPVLWGMYERKDTVKAPARQRWRTQVVRQIQDLRRSLDYLETRSDIDSSKLAYFGFSAGTMISPIALATEPRFHAAVLAVGGLPENRYDPDIDPFQFAPRARTPVLMMNGRYDLGYPLETSQRPLLNAFGAAPADKRQVILEAGHAMVGFPATTKESLTWLDRYLGPVPGNH